MKRCSWWLIIGFSLLVLGLAFCGYHYWHAGYFIPDTPQRIDGKNFIHTPRSDVRFGALLGGGLVLALASVMSLIGLVFGPRTRGCIVAALLGPLIISASIFYLKLV
jgi:hypothetical protein